MYAYLRAIRVVLPRWNRSRWSRRDSASWVAGRAAGRILNKYKNCWQVGSWGRIADVAECSAPWSREVGNFHKAAATFRPSRARNP